jgi:CheY-like chemotaxis protein
MTKDFAFLGQLTQLGVMTKPLALVVYEEILPGSQLVNRLQDLDYRVLTLANPQELLVTAQKEKPLLVIMALEKAAEICCAAIKELRSHEETAHIPLLAFGPQKQPQLQREAAEAGASLVASDSAILSQLRQLLEQILGVE